MKKMGIFSGFPGVDSPQKNGIPKEILEFSFFQQNSSQNSQIWGVPIQGFRGNSIPNPEILEFPECSKFQKFLGISPKIPIFPWKFLGISPRILIFPWKYLEKMGIFGKTPRNLWNFNGKNGKFGENSQQFLGKFPAIFGRISMQNQEFLLKSTGFLGIPGFHFSFFWFFFCSFPGMPELELGIPDPGLGIPGIPEQIPWADPGMSALTRGALPKPDE